MALCRAATSVCGAQTSATHDLLQLHVCRQHPSTQLTHLDFSCKACAVAGCVKRADLCDPTLASKQVVVELVVLWVRRVSRACRVAVTAESGQRSKDGPQLTTITSAGACASISGHHHTSPLLQCLPPLVLSPRGLGATPHPCQSQPHAAWCHPAAV